MQAISNDYDYTAAQAAGLKADETGHWPSRVPHGPDEGLILKSEMHPSFWKTVSGEFDAGYTFYRKNGRLYTFPAAQKVDASFKPDPMTPYRRPIQP
jgi:hypothetical protein